MDFSASSLIAGFIFGVWGFYFFRLAKRNGHFPLLGVSVLLIAYPYFVSGALANWGLGAALTALGFWLKSENGLT